MKRVLTFTLGCCLATTAFADIEKDIAACAAKSGDLERLSCYDQLAKQQGLNEPQKIPVTVQGVGKWDVSEKLNPIDDSKTVTLYLRADSGQSKWRKPVGMVVRCLSNKTDLFIVWNDYLGSKARVLSRVGSGEASTTNWSLSTDSKATFYPSGSITFIKNMMKDSKFVAQVTPYNESPITAVFDTTGLENAIKPLRETCNW